eukprot:614582-Pleurochrysis_carterae.AAC.4
MYFELRSSTVQRAAEVLPTGRRVALHQSAQVATEPCAAYSLKQPQEWTTNGARSSTFAHEGVCKIGKRNEQCTWPSFCFSVANVVRHCSTKQSRAKLVVTHRGSSNSAAVVIQP